MYEGSRVGGGNPSGVVINCIPAGATPTPADLQPTVTKEGTASVLCQAAGSCQVKVTKLEERSWRLANLGPIKEFIESEALTGRFIQI